MKTLLIRTALLALTGAPALPSAALADPIHRIENDAYWHHDSGWVFPERLGQFVREGAAQDVAGSRDAVAHYVRVCNGVRVVISVDVFPADSAAEQTTPESARAALLSAANGAPGTFTEAPLPLGKELKAARLQFSSTGNAPSQALYFVTAGEWRVRIHAAIPAAALPVAGDLDAFVQSQRWDSLH